MTTNDLPDLEPRSSTLDALDAAIATLTHARRNVLDEVKYLGLEIDRLRAALRESQDARDGWKRRAEEAEKALGESRAGAEKGEGGKDRPEADGLAVDDVDGGSTGAPAGNGDVRVQPSASRPPLVDGVGSSPTPSPSQPKKRRAPRARGNIARMISAELDAGATDE